MPSTVVVKIGTSSITDDQGVTSDKFATTANRYDSGASVGYKFDPRSYVVTAARYEHDDFGANIWQDDARPYRVLFGVSRGIEGRDDVIVGHDRRPVPGRHRG